MRRAFANFILKLIGWKSYFPQEFKFHKMVVISAPHTSTWDLFLMILVFWKEGMNPRFLFGGKYVKRFFKMFLTMSGGIVVDKSKNENIVDKVVSVFKKSNSMLFFITPEGTKYKVDKWKTGFYQIALQSNAVLCLGMLDYNKKAAIMQDVYNPSGDFEKDMTFIEKLYQKVQPKHPERYNKKIF